ncbi:MAG: hypothetical protein H0V17_05010 [Deltaproteobacteria bacterium]|nr:hypothetical protein [Deltaproteobacteria bacterium]
MLRFVAISGFLVACGPSKSDDKGVVDDSQPPSIPTGLGKADGSSKLVAVNVQSPHPYANNLDRTFSVSLANLPPCAQQARLHFRVLRTEADFDFVTVEPAGAPAQTFDGDRDDTWTDFFPINGTSVTVRLESDFSITRHGFEIDQIEWEGLAEGCPLVKFPPCADDAVDTAAIPGTCECPAIPLCAALEEVEVRLHTARGFNNRQKHTIGARAFETHPGPADGPLTTEWGTVDLTRLRAMVRRAAEKGLLGSGGYDNVVPAGIRRDVLQIKAGAFDVTFVAGEGLHTADVAAVINEFEALFTCGGGGLTCGDGFECEQGACIVVESCICPAIFDPVCGSLGQTFSNACSAGCAQAEVIHAGECGIAGDPCGGFVGAACSGDRKCRYGESQFEPPVNVADAGGTCVEPSYCDAPADCSGLPHVAVPGAWACNQNTCAWQAGLAWKAVVDGRFETAHPYANSTSVWKEVFLPSGAQALRLLAPSFALEANYDFLEVWTWNGAWQRVARFTGSAGPAATTEFAGRYHYLRFVSDSSVTKQGFRLDAEWR